MVEIPLEIVTSIGTGIAAGVVSNLVIDFLHELGIALKRVTEQHKYDIPPISYTSLNDFWEAYKKQEIREGDTISIHGVFSDLGLVMPASRPDEAIHAAKNALEGLLYCFSDDSNLDLQERISKFDAQIDILRLWLGSCTRLPLIKGFRYCNLFDENDVIPVRGLPLFLRKNIKISSPPFYGEVEGYVVELPSYWKRILKVRSKKPVAIIVDNEAEGKLKRKRELINPLYLSYWIIFKYRDGDGLIVATRGDYSNKENYKACRKFLKTTADVEVNKQKAQLLFEYDQVNRLTRYKQILDQKQIDEILDH